MDNRETLIASFSDVALEFTIVAQLYLNASIWAGTEFEDAFFDTLDKARIFVAGWCGLGALKTEQIGQQKNETYQIVFLVIGLLLIQQEQSMDQSIISGSDHNVSEGRGVGSHLCD